MKIEANELSRMYAEALKGSQLKPEAQRTALGVLEKVISDMASSDEAVLNELGTSPKYTHAVYGCFGDFYGHYIKEVSVNGQREGSPKNEKSVLLGLTEGLMAHDYDKFADGEPKNPEYQYKSRVSGKKTKGKAGDYVFLMTFPDIKGDHRGGLTSYQLGVPLSEKDRILEKIKANPEILVKVFQNMFPNYDRSEGKLKIDESFAMAFE